MAAIAVGQRTRDRWPYAVHAMEVWAAWTVGREELGWPREASEVRAHQRAMTATETTGVARWRGGVQLSGDRVVLRLPPPMPKETRATAGSRPLPIDRAKFGPQVHRLLLDMDEAGRCGQARILRAHYLAPAMTAAAKARVMGIPRRTYWRRLSEGLEWLSAQLDIKP